MPDPNPLLQDYHLLPFSAIRAEHLVPAIDAMVLRSRTEVARITASQRQYPNWDDLVLAMEAVTSRIDEVLVVISLLDSVNTDQQWMEASAQATFRAVEFVRELTSHRGLFDCYKMLVESSPAALFDASRQSLLRRTLSRFRLAGIELEPVAQKRLATLDREIAGLQQSFLTRLEQANSAWRKHITDESVLLGLSSALKARMARNARAVNLQGWLMTLNEESYRDCMAYAQNRILREEIFTAYNTRASDLGPHAGQFDNGPLLQRLMVSRNQKAKLLGYTNFVQLALEFQVLDTDDQVLAFIRDQISASRTVFAHDKQAITALGQELGLVDLQPWDHAFLAQIIRQRTSGIAEEELRVYFPLDTTLSRLFALVGRLFDIQIIELYGFDSWAPGVRLFQLLDQGEVLGQIYFVPYRQNAEDFPYALSLRNRWTTAESRRVQPMVVLFSQFEGAPDEPCLLGHRQLKILFHEFGHCFQHMMMGLGYRTKMGVDDVGMDSAEFCGQFFERWCDSPECLVWLSSHHETSANLPETLARQQVAYANTQTSWARAESLTMALFDIEVHRTQGDGRSIEQVFASANREVGHLPALDAVRYANGFSHMVSGYESGFYAYQWSEVLARAAFKRFEQEGVFNPQTGRAFRELVLAPGHSRPLVESVRLFLDVTPGNAV
ncbi:M3 family metallopeptidase [Pseudomonas sp. DWP1b1]|uniref:M3 family metallopeptidase n=1 Tax=unclassified Pseudomonas TaxID=196821 RepID=UPI003CF46352